MKQSERRTGLDKKTELRNPAAPSVASLLSSPTHHSRGSSASTATITHDLMAQPRTRNTKYHSSRMSSKRRSASGSQTRDVELLKPTSTTIMVATAKPNVFEFLDPVQSSTSLVPATGPLSDPPAPIATICLPDEAAEKEGLNNSFHSDSGISIPDSNSERDDSVVDEGQSPQEPDICTQDQALSVKRRPRPIAPRSCPKSEDAQSIGPDDVEDFSSPEEYYRRQTQTYPDKVPPSAPQPPPKPFRPISEDVKSIGSTADSGYNHMATNLSDGTIPPIYRRFTTLNHRILLHLQDEVTQMEEELHYLDATESQYRLENATAAGVEPSPVSRRLIPRSQTQSAVYFRRLDLLNGLAVKVEQYNQALCSFHKASHSLVTATTQEVDSYRGWLKASLPTSLPETRFLDRENDLVTISRKAVSLSADPAAAHFLIAIVVVAVVLPLLAFGAIPQVLGRLVVVGIVGAAVALFIGSSRIGAMVTPRDVGRGGAAYFSAMALAAMFIS